MHLLHTAAAALNAPAAVLVVLGPETETWPLHVGLPAALRPESDAAPPAFLRPALTAGEAAVAIADFEADAQGASGPLVAGGFKSLLAVALAPPGSAWLVVLDGMARAWTPREVEVLRGLGECVGLEWQMQALRHDIDRYRAEAVVFAGIPHGLFLLDPAGRFLVLNPVAGRFFQRVSGRPGPTLLGQSIWEACPEVADSSFAAEYRRAEAEGRDLTLETHFPTLHRWFAFHGVHLPEGLCVTFQDITARTEMEHSLQRRAEQLEAASRGREEFLHHLAHDLRNALAPIRNALHLWKARSPSDASVAQARDLAEREVQDISRLLEDMLRLTQAAGEGARPQLEGLDLATLLAQAVQTILASPDYRGHSLSVQLPPEPVTIAADRRMLAQVFQHLLHNAVKFTQPGGRITLEARREGEEVVIRVRDDGAGIAPEVLPQVFDLFMRPGNAEGRLRGGVGVGLTLVRRLVELHGGRVEAHSAGVGRGSEFVVRLRAPAPAAPALSERAAGSNGKRPPRVLVVDNSREAAQSFGLLLQLWGYDATLAYDPYTALEVARAHPPDVVLLDIGMPGMDGYEVARRLQQHEQAKKAVLVAVTGYGEDDDRRRAREAGFHYHMTKPVEPNDLRELLEMAGFTGRPHSSVA